MIVKEIFSFAANECHDRLYFLFLVAINVANNYVTAVAGAKLGKVSGPIGGNGVRGVQNGEGSLHTYDSLDNGKRRLSSSSLLP